MAISGDTHLAVDSDPGPVRDADTLRDSCWRRVWPVGLIVPSASGPEASA